MLIQFGATEGAAEPSGLAVLGIDPLALLLQMATFLILFLLLKRFALKKIVSMLEERQLTIDKGVDLGLQMEAEKEQLDKRVDKILHVAREQADQIIASGHHEAGVIIKAAEDAAARKTEAMLTDFHAQMSEDIERARKQLQKDTISLVAEATGVLLQEKLDAKQDAALIEQSINKVKA